MDKSFPVGHSIVQYFPNPLFSFSGRGKCQVNGMGFLQIEYGSDFLTGGRIWGYGD